jgi:16S rRNA C967 or C1407 C5-methylase (RsmB/RsmF family)/NOL1/NOP2/fmu family ribosome biogenesis protein
MVKLPQQLLDSLQHTKGFNREAFENLQASGEQVTSIRKNPFKPSEIKTAYSKIGWTEYGFYLAERPSFTFDPLFHAGCYYVQEASSMFLGQALKQTADLSQPLRVLDLCAAPGGKSTHIQSLISKDSLLVSNEVIRSRANVLKDNMIKWGAENVVVTNNDPKDFSKLENYFDVIVVDAPCSGSGLFRRDPEAIEEWSENNVQLCSQRQQRILADIIPALKNNGMLIYSTCSYSKEEDEDIVNWMKEELPLSYVPLLLNDDWGIVDSGSGYRFWPDKVKGEGFFISCFRKNGENEELRVKTKKKPAGITKAETEIIGKWMNTGNDQFIRHQQTVYVWPLALADDMAFLLEQLKLVYSGVLVGELVRDKLVPDHALAMSNRVAEAIKRVNLDYGQAIRFLQRRDLEIGAAEKGWQLAAYEGYDLGWMNVLGNRINNYYPKELRILKDN